MEPLLQAEEAALRLGISRWRVYDLIKRGHLQCVRLGRSIRVSPEELERFVANGGTGSLATPSDGDKARDPHAAPI